LTKRTESYELFKAIGSLASIGLFIYNVKQEKLEYVNPPLTEIFDISHPDFSLQIPFFTNHVIVEDKEYLKGEFEKLLQEEKAEDIEFRIKTHDGSIKNILGSAFLLQKRSIVAGFISDITKNREHETYMVDFGAKKDALLDMISHNLTGPLNLSNNLIESAEKAIEKKEDVREHIRVIKSTVNHCIEIISDFMEEEHLTSEHIFPKKSRFDVIGKIETLLDRMKKAAPEKNYIFNREAGHLFIVTDEVKFFQIVHNLISNAAKFTPDRGEIEIVVREKGKNIFVNVKDNGIGIPERLKKDLFKKYTSSGRPGLKGERSIGMGLYIVKQLVTILGGHVGFESEENKGSEFYFEMPNGDADT
jgi:two-component system, OmpR family, sensor histidine kinase VicK